MSKCRKGEAASFRSSFGCNGSIAVGCNGSVVVVMMMVTGVLVVITDVFAVV